MHKGISGDVGELYYRVLNWLWLREHYVALCQSALVFRVITS
jgi:hypothetical protein